MYLRLHVPMYDTIRVEVMQSFHQLLRHLLHCGFGELGVVLQDIEKLALGILRHHTKLSLCLEGIKHKDNVLVVQIAQNFDLLSEVL